MISAQATALNQRLQATSTFCAFIRVHQAWAPTTEYLERNTPNISVDESKCENMNLWTHDEGSLDAHEWRSVVRRSAFTLSPPGHNTECFRTWESASVGSIPVIVGSVDTESPCWKSAVRTLYEDTSAPFIFVSRPTKAYDAMLDLVRDPKRLRERRFQVKAWYHSQLKTAYWRAEAALTAAVSIADAIFGPIQALPSKRPYNTTNETHPVAIVPDEDIARDIINWLNDHNITAGFDLNSQVTVAWDQPRFPDTVAMAPVVHFSLDPLDHIAKLPPGRVPRRRTLKKIISSQRGRRGWIA